MYIEKKVITLNDLSGILYRKISFIVPSEPIALFNSVKTKLHTGNDNIHINVTKQKTFTRKSSILDNDIWSMLKPHS